MKTNQFCKGLGLVILFQLMASLILLKLHPPIGQHIPFILSMMTGMVVFCLLLFGAAQIVVRSTIGRLYIQLVMIAVFFKIALCLLIVIIYKKVFEPADHSFIWPFLVIYVSTTVFEVIFLEKVGRQKVKRPV